MVWFLLLLLLFLPLLLFRKAGGDCCNGSTERCGWWSLSYSLLLSFGTCDCSCDGCIGCNVDMEGTAASLALPLLVLAVVVVLAFVAVVVVVPIYSCLC